MNKLKEISTVARQDIMWVQTRFPSLDKEEAMAKQKLRFSL